MMAASEPKVTEFFAQSELKRRLCNGKLKPTQAYDAESAMDALPFLDPMARYMEETGFGGSTARRTP